MSSHTPILDWIEGQQSRMAGLVERWARINSGSINLDGLAEMARELMAAFAVLGGRAELVDLAPRLSVDPAGEFHETPLGQALRITKRPDAPRRVFLGIHMDTVFGRDNPFQDVSHVDAQTLNGPGVLDAKGGLAVMFVALEAFEQCPAAGEIGWEVLINPDEEIGSPGSAHLFAECAARNHIGLVFEPTLPDGTLAGHRGGSGNYTAVVRGRSAHAGREFNKGRNAIEAAADLVARLAALNSVRDAPASPSGIVNIGAITGGGPVNVVPGLAICRFNIRARDRAKLQHLAEQAEAAAEIVRQRDGISVELHGGVTSWPKLMDPPTLELFNHVRDCGEALGIDVRWQDTGGVCDGNKLAAAGLPTIDTLGPRGGGMHSEQEYLRLDSLTERAKLAALLLMRLAAGELPWPERRQSSAVAG